MKDELINRIICMFTELDPGIDIENIKSKLYIIMKDVSVSQIETALAVRDETVNDSMLRRFIASKMVKGCTPATIQIYNKMIKMILLKIGKPCTDITRDDVRIYIAYRLAQDRISKVTANSELRFLRSFFAWMTTEEIITKNPMLKIDPIKQDKVKKKAFTEIECEKIRAVCKSSMDTAIVEVLLSTGCRVSELCQMRIDELKAGEITVHGKGNKDRIVYLNARAEIALQRYLSERNDANPYIFPKGLCATSEAGRKNKNNPLWYQDSKLIGDGMRDKSSIESMMRKLGKRSGVENVHPHRFCRTCATFALKRGMPIELVSKMLGHEQLTTTQIYLDISDEELENAHKKYVL